MTSRLPDQHLRDVLGLFRLNHPVRCYKILNEVA
jgi:hypothetical protein